MWAPYNQEHRRLRQFANPSLNIAHHLQPGLIGRTPDQSVQMAALNSPAHLAGSGLGGPFTDLAGTQEEQAN